MSKKRALTTKLSLGAQHSLPAAAGTMIPIATRTLLHGLPTPLRDFFQRISFRKGLVSAISATARKLAVIIWNMVVKGVPYINPEGYLFLDQKRKLGLVKRIKKHPVTYGTVSPKKIWASKQLKFKTFGVRWSEPYRTTK